MTIDEESRRHAISRLSRKRAYRHQVINYLWVNGLLIVVWAFSGFGFFWPIYPLIGWGGRSFDSRMENHSSSSTLL
ncbi:2TM domain-containing protein [bacterium]|nr:2TM domain-containing protein [bacterium]